MIFFGFYRRSVKNGRSHQAALLPLVHPDCFVQSAGVFKFAKFLFCLGGRMVRDIDPDRHVLIAMDGRILHGQCLFPFNLILVPDCVPAAILHRTLPHRVENQRLTAEDCGGKRNADGRVNIHLLALPIPVSR